MNDVKRYDSIASYHVERYVSEVFRPIKKTLYKFDEYQGNYYEENFCFISVLVNTT